MGLALLLAFVSLSELAPLAARAADGVSEDGLYADRYRQFIDEIRRNVTLPLVGHQDTPEHEVTAVQEDDRRVVEVPLTLLEQLDPNVPAGPEPARLLIQRSDLYIVGFVVPRAGDQEERRFYFREVRDLPRNPADYVDIGYNDRYRQGLGDPNGVRVDRAGLQAAAAALRTADRSRSRGHDELRGHLTLLAVAVAEATRFEPIRLAVVNHLRGGTTWAAADRIWPDDRAERMRETTYGWLVNEWSP